MPQRNIIIYFLVILIFTVNYGNAIDVKVGDGYYPFDPHDIIRTFYDESITFIRIGTKTFILTESDTTHCIKSERPDAFYAVLTDEQPKATFIPKNTGRTEFYIYTNDSCGLQNICIIHASKRPQGGPQGPKEPKENQPSSNNSNNSDNNDNNNHDNNHDNNHHNNNNNTNYNNTTITIINGASEIPTILGNCSVIGFAIIGLVTAHFIL